MLKITGLTKKYKDKAAVDNFNFEIEKGKIYGVVGPNGAGKTTFFKILAGLVSPTSGEITVATGESLEKYRQKMSFMIETPYLYETMTAWENMKIIGGIRGEKNPDRLRELLDVVKLSDTGRKKVKQFSLGMRQRLGIACALTSDPEILVLDEPMNGVDAEGIVELRQLLLNLRREMGVTMLISSHILEELFQLSTDFIFIKDGRIRKITDKKGIEDSRSGVIEIVTTDQQRAVAFLKDICGEEAVSQEGENILVRAGTEKEEILSKKIMDEGIGIKKYYPVQMSLEEFYMKEIIGDAKG